MTAHRAHLQLMSKPRLIAIIERMRADIDASQSEAKHWRAVATGAAECLAEAMADPHIVGVWGGLDEQQRARLHKERKAPPTGPKEIKHGTPGGARTHRKRGEEPCDRCTAAAKASNARYQQRKTAKRRIERAIA